MTAAPTLAATRTGAILFTDLVGFTEFTDARGDRDYEGLTSTHVPVATNSRISQWGIEISGLAPVAAGWAAGGRIGLHRIDRDIASAGRAQGYPERFRFGELALGARLALADSPGLRLAALAWLGAGPAGRMTLQLPNADAAELRLGGSRSLALELLALGAAGVPGWHWQARLGHRREQWAAGPAQVITRQGIPVAGAVQPATRQSTLDLQAGLRFDF